MIAVETRRVTMVDHSRFPVIASPMEKTAVVVRIRQKQALPPISRRSDRWN